MQNNPVTQNAIKIEDALKPTQPVEQEKKSVKEKKKKTSKQADSIFVNRFLSIILSIILFGGLFSLSFWVAYKSKNKPVEPQNFDECIKSKGSFIKETYPSTCISKSGQQFIQSPPEEEKKLLESDLQKNDCIITGCSNEICSNEEVITTCVYKKEYECLSNAICEKQSDGACGWTYTDSYYSCFNSE